MRIFGMIFIFFCFIQAEFIQSVNSIEDTKTNLMWQDTVEVNYKEDITLGRVYCEELILNGHIDWRLPTLKELQTLIDQNGGKNYLNKKFLFFKKGNYWSNTLNILDRTKYWVVDFQNGKVSSESGKTLNHIRCVRDNNGN